MGKSEMKNYLKILVVCSALAFGISTCSNPVPASENDTKSYSDKKDDKDKKDREFKDCLKLDSENKLSSCDDDYDYDSSSQSGIGTIQKPSRKALREIFGQ